MVQIMMFLSQIMETKLVFLLHLIDECFKNYFE